MNNLSKQWEACLKELEETINDQVRFDTFFRPIEFYEYKDYIVKLLVSVDFYKKVLYKDKDLILEVVQKHIDPMCKDVVILQQGEIEKPAPEIKTEPPVEVLSNLKEEYTFDQFVVGSSNKVAQAASLAVAITPGTSFNPLFIYGNSGLGKTHLLNAIGNYAKKNNAATKVLYIPCSEFVDDYVSNIQNNTIEVFNKKYQHLDILLVDDIQFLARKEKSHEMFFNIFNRMIQQNKQIVITSDRMPQDIAGLEQRLVSRFNSGLSVGIDSPEFETALAILRKKLEMRNFDMDSIDDDVLTFMATNFSGNVRDLEGAVNRLIFYTILENTNRITMNVALEAFKDHSSSTVSTGKLTTEKIIKTVAEYYNLTLGQLVGKSRMSNITTARHIGMYLMRDLLNLSYIKIGEEFGGRDHSTVMSACDKVQKLIAKDASYKEAIVELKTKLK